MIIFELNGQTSHMIPVLISVLCSYCIANQMAKSIFDVMLELKNLPFLPQLTNVKSYAQTAGDLMNKNFMYLTKNATLGDLTVIIGKVGSQPYTIPVVESEVRK